MRRLKTQNTYNDTLKTIAEILIVIILAIFVASIINGAVFDTTRVSGRSMDETLYGGKSNNSEYDSTHYNIIEQDTPFDKFFFGAPDTYGDKVVLVKTKNVERGDIVVFITSKYNDNEQWIKRVIGTPGDKVVIRENEVWVNDQLLEEDYISSITYPYRYPIVEEQVFVVGDNELFVLGDNRQNSTDSRVIGCISQDSLIGRVVMVIKKDTKKIVNVKNL